jgi:RNA polymerase sigma-B factor
MIGTAAVPDHLASDVALAARVRRGDNAAREALVRRYLPLARGLALRYRRSSEPIDDLVQVASLGLLKAVDRWDAERKLSFSSYAVPTILGELRRYFRDATWNVRPPRGLQELCVTVERSRAEVRAATGRDADVAELARLLRRPAGDVEEALQAMRGRIAESLEAPHDHLEGDGEIGERYGAEDAGFREADARMTVDELLAAVDQRTRLVLRLRFHEDLTQTEIAERIGVSQMHVSRILRRALERLAAHADAGAVLAR